MNQNLSKRDIYLRLHGLPAMRGRVGARVFAAKLGYLTRAIEATDKAVNGGKRFQLVISELDAKHSATAILTEIEASRKPITDSSVRSFGVCIEAVKEGRFSVAREYQDAVRLIRSLAHDSERRFSYGELQINGYELIRIDQFLTRQAEEALQVEDEAEKAPQWFKGTATGSFDGQIMEVDLRGDIPQVKLILTAGGAEIDCICPRMDTERLGAVLGQRVRVFGNAYYDGKSGLPVRIEASDAKPIKADADIRRWRGAFEPFEPELWEGDE